MWVGPRGWVGGVRFLTRALVVLVLVEGSVVMVWEILDRESGRLVYSSPYSCVHEWECRVHVAYNVETGEVIW